MPEETTVRFRWTLEEVTKASRWHYRAGPRMRVVRILCWVVVALCAGITLLAYVQKWHMDRWWLGLLAALYFLGLLRLRAWIALWRARRSYAKSTGRDSEIEWIIGETSLRVRGAHSVGELSWAAFNKAVLTPDGLLLYPQPIIFHWLPRHAFASETAFQEVCDTARRNLPDYRRLK